MSNKIKIAQVITRLDWGGSPDIVRLICTMSDSERFDMRLVTGASANLSLLTKEFYRRMKGETYHINHLKRNINPFNDIIALLRLYRLFKKERFDIVHTHTAKAGLLGRIAARLAGVPYIIHTPHGHNLYGYFGTVMTKMIVVAERMAGRFTNRIVALTELEKRDLVRFKISTPERITVIESGVELDRFLFTQRGIEEKKKELLIEEDEAIVGMVGRLEHVKGPEYFIESINDIIAVYPKTRFLVVGDGSLRKKLEYRCQKLGIIDKVIFTGWREDTPQIMQILDVLVLPSLNEAVGRVILEAGACGVPAVATRVGGIPEVIKDGETGILVPPRSPRALADGVLSLLADSGRRQEMSEAAKRFVDDRFSSERMVESILTLYIK